ncbi:phage tail tape measure protein [Streptomyces sp. BBFR2]|uniref:phage tail tape measure protein n=1 Tax=Streptomyces sp. BBFR2 TaxID=3372854 RepID=UPI0037D9F627
MALNVGELLATIDVDDGPAARGLNRAEQRVAQAGQTITSEADRSGRQAGQQLGDGLADGADEGAQRSGGRLRSRLGALGWAAVGATIGGAVMAGLGEAMQQQKDNGLLAAQLGANPTQAKRLGKVAGQLYSQGYTDSVGDANEALKALWQQGLVPTSATQKELARVGGRLTQVAQIMGEDVGPTANAVGQMLKTGMAKNASEAFDILVKGTQNGANKSQDLLDVLNEYSTQFRDMGVSGKQAMGMIQQGLAGGARDADIVADAFKELNIRVKDGTGADALKQLGLNADQMAAAFSKGGPAANSALDQIMDRLRAVKDPTEQFRISQGLLGTQSEDLSKALMAIDPSSAVASLGKVDGAARKAGDTMRDNASTKVTAFTRSLQQGFVEVVGTYVIPAATSLGSALGSVGSAFTSTAGFVGRNKATFIAVASVITVLMLPTLVQLSVQAGMTTAAVVTGWATQGAAGAAAAARFVAMNAMILAGWISQGGAATATAARTVAAWVLMGAQSMAQGARMAVAWALAMGPIPLIIAGIVALVALIVTNWDTIKNATAAAWNWVWGNIKAVGAFILNLFVKWSLPGIIASHWSSIKNAAAAAWDWLWSKIKSIGTAVVNFFVKWSLIGLLIRHWDSIKSGAERGWNAVLGYLRGIPGKIAGFFSGLGNLLLGKGRDLVLGLWRGISSMGPWLRATLMGWAKRLIPGPIAKALGIHSPSRVMARDVGRWIPAGLVKGIEGGQSAVDRTMRRLIPSPAAAGMPAMATAGVGGGFGAAGGGPLLHIENWHAGASTADQTASALAWQMKGRG